MLSLIFVIYLMVKKEGLPSGSMVFTAFLGLILIKELINLTVSNRFDTKILKPLEALKNGVYQVAEGNYDVQVNTNAVHEIGELIEAFNAMSLGLKESEVLQQKYETNRRELISNISHDLKTPITSINGFIDGIVDGVANTPEKQEAYFRIIQQNVRYMNRLIDDLLLYSKLDMHAMTFDFSKIPFGLYVTELFSELELEGEERGVAMTLDNQLVSDVELTIDPRHLTRAVRNIVANAVTHSQVENVQINFHLSQEADFLLLAIRDNGVGMAPEQLDKIFDRFYRIDDARSSTTGGSGLGLAIAKEIVEAHGGYIRAESEWHLGTTILIRLPIIKNMDEKTKGQKGA
jgi:signal transduction histidine kinase